MTATNVTHMPETHKPEPPSQPVRQHTTADLARQMVGHVYPGATVRGDLLILPLSTPHGTRTLEISCESNGAYQFHCWDAAAELDYLMLDRAGQDPDTLLGEHGVKFIEDDECFWAYAERQADIAATVESLRTALTAIVWCAATQVPPKPAVTTTDVDRLYGELLDSLTAFRHAVSQAELDTSWRQEALDDLIIAEARIESLICENGDCARLAYTRLPDRLCREHADAYEPCSHCGRLFLRGQMQGTEDGWTCAGCEVGR